MECERSKIVVDDVEIVERWNAVSSSENLGTDADVAKYLIALYSSLTLKERDHSGARCIRCHTPLTLSCTVCPMFSQQAPPSQGPLSDVPPPQAPPSQLNCCAAAGDDSELDEDDARTFDVNSETPEPSPCIEESVKTLSVCTVDSKMKENTIRCTLEQETEDSLTGERKAEPTFTEKRHLRTRSATLENFYTKKIVTERNLVKEKKLEATSDHKELNKISSKTKSDINERSGYQRRTKTKDRSTDSEFNLASMSAKELKTKRHILTKKRNRTVVCVANRDALNRHENNLLTTVDSENDANIHVLANPNCIFPENFKQSKKDHSSSGGPSDSQHSPKTKGRPRSKLVSAKYLGVLKKPNGQTQFYSRFECAHCQKIFDKKSDFNKHISTHYDSEPHICIKCGEGFSTRQELRQHKRSTHSKLKKPPIFMCDQCPAEFKTEGRFHLHKKLHEENKLFSCKTCGFVASSKQALNNHRLTHRKAARVQCEYCGETKRINNMQRHILMHRGEKPYECTQCDAAFRTPFDLKDHVKRRHSEVKPFSCEICGKGFICSDNLKHHLLVHSGQKPFKCSLCPSSFSRKDYLTKHVRAHTGEKPYKCGDCGEAFAYPNSLKLHRKQHHSGGTAGASVNGMPRETSGPMVTDQFPATEDGQVIGSFLPAGIWLPSFSGPNG